MRDGEALLAFGVMGAAMQPQGQVQVLSNMLDFGMGLQAAGDAPRVRHEGSTEPTGAPPLAGGGTVHLEPGFDAAAIEGLRARGHRIEPMGNRGAFGGYQAIRRELAHGRLSRRVRVAQGRSRRRLLSAVKKTAPVGAEGRS